MTYSSFIALIRSDVRDYAKRRYETGDGDGSTAVFNLQNPKVLESSYTYKISGVTQTESSDYDQDVNVGQVVFRSGHIPASGNDNVTFEYKSVNETDADWLDIINQVLQELRKKIWIEFTDETTLTSVINQVDYALSSVAADVLHLLDVEYRLSSSDPWQKLGTNVVFYRDLQKLHIRPAFDSSGLAIRLRGNRAYVQGATTAATFEVQTKFYPVVRKLCQAIYWERRAADMAKEVGAVSQEKFFENIESIQNISITIRKEAYLLLSKLRMPRPATAIPIKQNGINA